jgi:ribosomal protein S18 acetylase RimI-like enzyme
MTNIIDFTDGENHMERSNLKERLLHELEENFWEGWAYFGKGEYSTLVENENMIWFRTPLPMIPYNSVLKFQVTENVEKEIDEIIERCSAGGHDLAWAITPSSKPKDLTKRLEKRGLFEAEAFAGMGRSLKDLPEIPELPTGIKITEVNEKEGKQEFIEFATWRWSIPEKYHNDYRDMIAPFEFGRPGSKFSAWQAWMDGKPVSKVAVSRSKNSVGIYAVATKPEARRMGLAGILTLHALHQMRKEGYELAVLHSTPMAESLYASLGFEKIATFYIYAKTELHIYKLLLHCQHSCTINR